MKKRRIVKIVSVVLVTVVLFQILAVAASAESSSRTSYLRIKSEIAAEVKTRSTVTDGVTSIQQNTVVSWIESAMNSLRTDYGINSPSFDNVVKLANIFAAYYGCNGVVSILVVGYLSRNEADRLYSDRWMNDAYRHTTWCFRGAKLNGVENMRKYSTSYEWANVLHSDWINYYNERISYYTNSSSGYTSNQIEEKAYADAADFACELRYALQSEVANQKWKFNQAFCEDPNANAGAFYYTSIMDYFNNRVGCNYAESNPSYSHEQMFNIAYSNGEIITFAPSLSSISSQSSSVFLTGWWELF